MLTITEATLDQLPLVRKLFTEYANSLEFDLGFQGFDDELESLPGIYSSPHGCILLASFNSKFAGCAALKPIDNKISEMKRLFVRPEFQGLGIGRALASEILKKASAIGYEKIRLDTVPSMQAAQKMYQSMGFYSIPPYRENPVLGTSYLERDLTS